MIIVEENTTATIKMYLRDDTLNDFDQYVLVPILLKIISEDERKDVFQGYPITWTYDSFNKLLTFTYDISALLSESFYIIQVWEDRGSGLIKLLSQDKMYIMPSGASVSTYQPKLTTTERTMDNEFIVYGE